jgi:heme exporter protein A
MEPADPERRAALLEARTLTFARGGEPIFGPLTFELHGGEALVIEGDNGSGKTTLVRMLAGLIEPSSGELLWQGEAVGPKLYPTGSVAVLGHALGLKGELDAVENLRFRIGLTGLRAGMTPHAAIASVALEGFEDVPVRALSAGQRKRVALAALLLSPAPLWLLDEPYANLDRNGQVLVDRMLETHCRRGGAVLLTSHGLIQPTLSKMRTQRMAGARAA